MNSRPSEDQAGADSTKLTLPVLGDAGPWYRDGLKFTCTQCGNCCTGAPGYVWVNEEELQQIADFTGKPIGEVRLLSTKRVGRELSLREHANGDCVYFDGATRGCTIYPVRPRQCRTWPFWNSNLESPETWRATRSACPGAGQGQHYDRPAIEASASVIDV